MTVKQIRNDGGDTLICCIKSGMFAGSGAIIKDLNAAVDVIMSSLDNDGLYFRAIDISGKWTLGQGDFDPWEGPSSDAWAKIVKKTGLHDQLWEWLDRIEPILAKYLAENFEGLHENEDAQLGEVPASLLALNSPRFVPMYTRLLSAWDLDHGVHQNLVCIGIVKAHGRTPEVEELLYELGVKHFNTDVFEALRETLSDQYGDFTKSDLFHRIVTDVHTPLPEVSEGKRDLWIFSYCPNWPELTDAAQRIIAELATA
jgi:hypothetical protein